MNIEPLKKKWEAFGWNVLTCDGNDLAGLLRTFEKAVACQGMPTVMIASTIMGKGVRSIEGDYGWHGKAPSKEQLEVFLKELEDAQRS